MNIIVSMFHEGVITHLKLALIVASLIRDKEHIERIGSPY